MQNRQSLTGTIPMTISRSELEEWLQRIDSDLNAFRPICETLMVRMRDCGPSAAMEYDRIAESFGRKKRLELEDYKAAVCDLNAALTRFQKEKDTMARPRKSTKDEWLDTFSDWDAATQEQMIDTCELLHRQTKRREGRRGAEPAQLALTEELAL